MDKLQITCLIILAVIYFVGFALSHGYWKADCGPAPAEWKCRLDAADSAFFWPFSWLSVLGASFNDKEGK